MQIYRHANGETWDCFLATIQFVAEQISSLVASHQRSQVGSPWDRHGEVEMNHDGGWSARCEFLYQPVATLP